MAEKKRLLLPNSLLLPLTPHEKRMRIWGSSALPRKDDPNYHRVINSIQSSMDADFYGLKQEANLRWKQAHSLTQCNVLNGTGFIMSRVLREQLLETFNRIAVAGLHSLQGQFNIFEAFFRYEPDYLIPTLRNEIDHLLNLSDYFAWYENDRPQTARHDLLINAFEEGVIYSYNMTNGPMGLILSTDSSELVIAGISMVRHETELTCVIVAGENPPVRSDDEAQLLAKEMLKSGPADPEKEFLFKNRPEGLTVDSRYLPEFPGFSRLHVLLRYDLRSWSNVCSYIAQDNGFNFNLYTNDPRILDSLSRKRAQILLGEVHNAISRYRNLVSAATTLVFLPVAFAAEHRHVTHRNFQTELKSHVRKKFAKVAKSKFKNAFLLTRTVACLATTVPKSVVNQELPAIDFEFKTHGYWRDLKVGEIGEDEKGDPVVGKTWVTTTESWAKRTLDTFLIQRKSELPDGPNAGYVYIMRCPGHDVGVFKVGLTQLTPAERSDQLSRNTSSPLPFGVLASWWVQDCYEAEKAIHKELQPYRINPRREYFRVELAQIISIAQRICSSS